MNDDYRSMTPRIHEARREILQLSLWRVRMPPSVFSAFPPDAPRKMTPSGLSRGPSMRHPAVPNALRTSSRCASSRRSANPMDKGSRWRR
jgi:hypothetical protein